LSSNAKENEEVFTDIDGLAEYLRHLNNFEYDKLEKLCDSLVSPENDLDIQFEAWLIAIGKRKEIRQWKEVLSSEGQ